MVVENTAQKTDGHFTGLQKDAMELPVEVEPCQLTSLGGDNVAF